MRFTSRSTKLSPARKSGNRFIASSQLIFFDLVLIDECHRGSATDDSAWREVLDYFRSATHLGLTGRPKETKEVSNITYFGDPVYTYSLKQSIEDGFLAPYKVIRIATDVDAVGYMPEKGN